VDRGSKPASGRPRQIVLESLSQKYPTQNRVGRVAEVVERLPNTCRALSTTKKKKKKKRRLLYSMKFLKITLRETSQTKDDILHDSIYMTFL
jgi:hypothetical protein